MSSEGDSDGSVDDVASGFSQIIRKCESLNECVVNDYWYNELKILGGKLHADFLSKVKTKTRPSQPIFQRFSMEVDDFINKSLEAIALKIDQGESYKKGLMEYSERQESFRINEKERENLYEENNKLRDLREKLNEENSALREEIQNLTKSNRENDGRSEEIDIQIRESREISENLLNKVTGVEILVNDIRRVVMEKLDDKILTEREYKNANSKQTDVLSKVCEVNRNIEGKIQRVLHDLPKKLEEIEGRIGENKAINIQVERNVDTLKKLTLTS